MHTRGGLAHKGRFCTQGEDLQEVLHTREGLAYKGMTYIQGDDLRTIEGLIHKGRTYVQRRSYTQEEDLLTKLYAVESCAVSEAHCTPVGEAHCMSHKAHQLVRVIGEHISLGHTMCYLGLCAINNPGGRLAMVCVLATIYFE